MNLIPSCPSCHQHSLGLTGILPLAAGMGDHADLRSAGSCLDAHPRSQGSTDQWDTGREFFFFRIHAHRIHGAAIYGNMDPINIPQSC